MFSFLKRLFSGAPSTKRFQFLTADRGDPIPLNRWYRLDHWQSVHFLRMNADWDKDWKSYSAEEEVVGVTFESRQEKFLVMGDAHDFQVFLERDPLNTKDKNAIKVMGSATVKGARVVEQLGFLSKGTAKSLKGEPDIDARPYSVYLPHGERRFGLRVQVLTRSQAYRKRTGQVTTTRKKKAAKKPVVFKADIRKEVFDDVYDFFEDGRDDYDCKKVSKKLFKTVFDGFFDAAMKKRGLIEQQINAQENDHDLDLSEDLTDALDDIVDRLFVIKPELRKRA